MDRPRTLVVDDCAATRQIIRRILERECDVVAEAQNGREAIDVAERLRPDLIVLDISMPIMDGLQAARHILARAPQVHIIFFSQHTNFAYADEAFRIGGGGYVVKEAADAELIEAVREVLAGKFYRSPLTSRG
jgi:DNA-binding NarL/FixJ family response regulator